MAGPRFTRDIDVLANEDDLDLMKAGLARLGYEETAEPWMLPNTALTLLFFLKVQGQDELLVDLLLASEDEDLRVVRDAVLAESAMGHVQIVRRRDIIKVSIFE